MKNIIELKPGCYIVIGKDRSPIVIGQSDDIERRLKQRKIRDEDVAFIFTVKQADKGLRLETEKKLINAIKTEQNIYHEHDRTRKSFEHHPEQTDMFSSISVIN